MCFPALAAVELAEGAAAFTEVTSTGLATVAGEGVAAGAAAGAATAASTGMSAMQTASLVSSVAGTALQASGQAAAAEAQRQAAEYNRKVALIQADDALNRGSLEQEAAGRKISQLRGQQRANMAANGLDLSMADQSPDAILAQTDYYGLEDQRTIANNANREAANFKNRANLYAAQANDSSSLMIAGGSMLTGAGVVADKWYRYNNGGRNYANDMGV